MNEVQTASPIKRRLDVNNVVRYTTLGKSGKRFAVRADLEAEPPRTTVEYVGETNLKSRAVMNEVLYFGLL